MIHKLNFQKDGPQCGQPLGPSDQLHEVNRDLSIAAGRNDAVTCMRCLSLFEQDFWNARFTIERVRGTEQSALNDLIALADKLLQEKLNLEVALGDARQRLMDQDQDLWELRHPRK